jgi:selenocysteine lyase/cysteine desulfurase
VHPFLRLIAEQERHPDNWFRRRARLLYEENIEAAAKFVGADPKNLVLVPNATSGEVLARGGHQGVKG